MKKRALGTVGMLVLAAACAACSGDEEGDAAGAPEGAPVAGDTTDARAFELEAKPTAIVRKTSGGKLEVRVHGARASEAKLEIDGLPSGIRAESSAIAVGSGDAVIMLAFAGEPQLGEHPIKIRARSGDDTREVAATLLVADDPGVLDATFATKGLASGLSVMPLHKISVDEQGRTLVTGNDSASSAFVTRYSSTGAPDPTFDGKGTAKVSFHPVERSLPITAVPRGLDAVFVAGAHASSVKGAVPCIAKLDGAAKPDAGFGKDGVACFASPVFGEVGLFIDVVTLPDGSLLAAGMAGTWDQADAVIVKLTPSGELDGSFGAGGVTRWSKLDTSEQAYDVAVDSRGRVLAAGFSVHGATKAMKPVVIRLDENGQPDPWFGQGGMVLVERSVPEAAAMSMVLGTNDEIYLAGAEAMQPVIYALEPEKGAPLASFGQGGARLYPELGAGRFGSVVWDEGKLLASGGVKISGVDTAITARLSATDGAPDATFANAGVMQLPFGGNAPALATAPSSRAVVLLTNAAGFTVARAWR